MDLKTLISKNLKSLRNHYGMTQTEFARYCKLQQRTYGRLENGENWQHLESLTAIAKHCDLDVWQIITPIFDPKNPPVIKEISDKEKQFYESIRAAAKQIAGYEQ